MKAVDDLVATGLASEHISILLSDTNTLRAPNTNNPAAQTSGSVIAGTLGFLEGIGAIEIAGSGRFIAAGPIMAALKDAGRDGPTQDLIGALIGMGIPEDDAAGYEVQIKEGGVLLSVNCETAEEVMHAKRLLEQTHAHGPSGGSAATGPPPPKL